MDRVTMHKDTSKTLLGGGLYLEVFTDSVSYLQAQAGVFAVQYFGQ